MNINTQKTELTRMGKGGILSKLQKLLSTIWGTAAEVQQDNEVYELLANISLAKNDWVNACTNFEHVHEKEIVDYYIYKIRACQEKYEYLIKQAKEKGVKTSHIQMPVNYNFKEGVNHW